jgi:hypothetical protein
MPAVYAEEELLAVIAYWTTSFNVFPEHLEGIIVNRQSPLATVLEFRSNRFLYLDTAARAKLAGPAQSGTAIWTGELNPCLEMLDNNPLLLEVDIVNTDPQNLRHPAAKPKE